MDETKDTTKNPPSGSGTASEGSEGTTPKADTKTYTQEELDKAIQKDRIARGRDAKSFELREQTLTQREEAIKAKEAEREAAEYAEAQQDPDKLAAYQAKQAEKQREKSLKEREVDLTKREAEHAEKIEAAEEALHEIALWEIAASHTTDPKEMSALKARLEETNIKDREQLEKVAEAIMPKTPETDETKMKVDSGVTSGAKESVEGKSSRQLFKEDFQDKEKKK